MWTVVNNYITMKSSGSFDLIWFDLLEKEGVKGVLEILPHFYWHSQLRFDNICQSKKVPNYHWHKVKSLKQHVLHFKVSINLHKKVPSIYRKQKTHC